MAKWRNCAAVFGLIGVLACSRDDADRGDHDVDREGNGTSEARAPSDRSQEEASLSADDTADQQGNPICEKLIPPELRDGAELVGELMGRLLVCKLKRAGKDEQSVLVDCSGKTTPEDMERSGGGLEKLEIGRAAYRSPVGGVNVLASRADCHVQVLQAADAEALARAVEAALTPDNPLVSSGALECGRLIPEALRTDLGATEKLEQESYLEGTVSCKLERAARGLEAASAQSTRTVLKVGYDCRLKQIDDSVAAQFLKEQVAKRNHEEVAIGRGGFYDGNRTVTFIDGQARCKVEATLYQPGPLDYKKVAAELEAALTPEAIGK